MIEREYEYKPKLINIFLGVGFFGLSAVISAVAARENSGLTINGIVHLSAYQASVFWCVICIISICFVLAAGLMVVQRFKIKQRIAFTTSSLLVPKSRWSKEERAIEYKLINSLSTEKIQSQDFLYIFHSTGKYTILASMLSSKAVYKDLCEVLSKKIAENRPT